MASTDPDRRSSLPFLALCAVGVAVVVVLVVLAARDRSTEPATDEGAPTTSWQGAPSSTAPSSTAPSTTTSTSTTLPVTTTTTPTGRFLSAAGDGPVHGTGRLLRYRAEVEEGSGVDPTVFAAIVDAILADPRGWTTVDDVAFQRVSAGPTSFTVTLATPATTDQICLPLDTNGRYSCREGGRAIFNLRRWNEATPELPFSVDDYRRHVVNHEVGHVLGHDHRGCGGAGLLAPVMMQQSKGLDGCIANAWPTADGT